MYPDCSLAGEICPFPPLIYLVIYLYQSGLLDIYFILWVII